MVYVFLYGRLYLILSGLEKELSTEEIFKISLLRKRLLLSLLCKLDFILMHLQLAPVSSSHFLWQQRSTIMEIHSQKI